MTARHKVRKWRRNLQKATKDFVIDVMPISNAPNCIYSKTAIILTLFEIIARGEYPSPYTHAARLHGRKIPDADTIYYRTKDLTLDQVESIGRDGLAKIHFEAKEMGAFSEPLPVAMDLTEEPVYGKPDPSTIGSIKTKGTKHAHQMLTIQAVRGNHLLPLALRKRTQLDHIPKVATSALEEAKSVVHLSVILADRGFWGVESIQAILEYGETFVVPAPKNKRIKKKIKEARRLARQEGKRYEFVHIEPDFELGDSRKGVKFAVVYIFRPEEARIKPNGKKRPEHFVFGTRWPVTHEQALKLSDLYDHRWMIETGYRDSDRLEGKTRSQRPAIQWLFFVLSMLLYAIWVLGRILWAPHKAPTRKTPARYELTKFWIRYLLSRCTRWKMWRT